MKVSIVSVGRVRQKFIVAGEKEYLQRLTSDLKVDLQELGCDAPTSLSPNEARIQEAERILQKVSQFDLFILLDERGKALTTENLKDLMQGYMQRGVKRICFLIGGAYGVDETVRQAADYVLSLSSLTFPHQLARLILVEQVYRVQTLWRGTAYHKGG